MSIPVITPGTGTRCQAITDVIEATALEKTALGHIINAEGEKIQQFLTAGNIDQITASNTSVRSMVSAITRLELVLQTTLDLFEDCICTGCNIECATIEDTALAFVEALGPENTITKINNNDYQVTLVDNVTTPVEIQITTTPVVPITALTLDPGLSLLGNILSVDSVATTPLNAVLQIGESLCTELLNITVTIVPAP